MKTKLTIAAVALCCTANSAFAQLNFNLGTQASVRPATERVLNDYTDRYRSIIGDTISYGDNMIVFASTVKPAGAVECSMYKYLHEITTDYAWKAVMLRTEDYKEAVKRYNACYKQLNNVAIKSGAQNWRFKGDYVTPDEGRNFYSTVLRTDTDQEGFQNLRVEILMENNMLEWTVTVLVYDRDREDWEGTVVR